MTIPKRKPKILYFVTEDWYFCSHRLPLAIAARDSGFEVAVVTRPQKHAQKIIGNKFKLIPLHVHRSGLNPLQDISTIFKLINIYRRERPDIVHHVALKPVIYGSIAARIAQVPFVVNALTGLGFVFISNRKTAMFLKNILRVCFRYILNNPNSRLIIQNPDDMELLEKTCLIKKKLMVLIKGSGVDTAVFSPTPKPEAVPEVVLASRMLWDKGIGEFVKAAQTLKSQGVKAYFMLVGGSDPENPAAISTEQLKKWHKEGYVQWIGHTEDILKLFSRSHIVCLPTSYGEGVPKVLIEAAACGLPIVATDVPGCREIVKNGINGFLVPAKNAQLLAEAILTLINSPLLRSEMGKKGRELVEKEFSIEKVISETLTVYRELLSQ